MTYEIGAEEPVSVAVVYAVSSAEHRSVDSLPPLTEWIDTDALNNLCVPPDTHPSDWHGQISFRYSNSLVTIDLANSSIDVTTPTATIAQ